MNGHLRKHIWTWLEYFKYNYSSLYLFLHWPMQYTIVGMLHLICHMTVATWNILENKLLFIIFNLFVNILGTPLFQ